MQYYLTLDAVGKVQGLTTQPQDMKQDLYVLNNWTQILVDETDPRVQAIINPPVSQQQPLKDKLTALDAFMSRGLEDFWIATNFNVLTLPPIQQQRLSQKQTLRAQLAALIKAGTP